MVCLVQSYFLHCPNTQIKASFMSYGKPKDEASLVHFLFWMLATPIFRSATGMANVCSIANGWKPPSGYSNSLPMEYESR